MNVILLFLTGSAIMARMRTPNDGPGTKRAKMFRFIVEYKLSHDGCAPGYADIMDKIHIASKSTVHYQLRALARLNMIDKVPRYRKNRTIEIMGGYVNAKKNWPEFFEGEL